MNYNNLATLILVTTVFSIFFVNLPIANCTSEIIVKEGESIQAAINLAPAGSTIIIMPGSYRERIEINKTLTIIGSGNKTIISGSGTSTCVKISRGVTRVVLANLTIDGTGTYKSTGLWIQQSNNNQIRNITITNFYKGLRIYDSLQNLLRSVRMLNNTYNLEVYGLYLSHFIHDIDSSNTVNGKKVCYLLNARDVKLTGDAGFVAIVNSTNVVVADMTLSNNFSGLLLAYTNDTFVSGINCTQNIQGIRLVNSHNITITNSSLTFNEWSGISLEPATTCKIHSNIFKFNEHALYLSFAPYILQVTTMDNEIFLNEISDNEVGIYFDEVNFNKIYNNNFVNNSIAIKIDDAAGNFFVHNNFLGNAKDVEIIATSFSNVTNTWDYGYPYGGNFWSNFNETDSHKGLFQDIDGYDGILDKPYSIGFNNLDKYPLSGPVKAFPINHFEQNPFEVFGFFSEILDFNFDPTFCLVSFKIVTDTASSFCRIGIPKNLLWNDKDKWEVLLNGSKISYEIFSSANHTFLCLLSLESGSILEVKVLGTGAVPEYSFTSTNFIILLVLMFSIILFMSKVNKKSRNKLLAKNLLIGLFLFMALQISFNGVYASVCSTQGVLIVGEDGFKTIREAVEYASDGDKILVRTGIYKEQVIINKSLVLCGEGLEATIIETNSTIDAVVIIAGNVSVRGFTIRNFGGLAYSCGIRLINASNCKIEENLVEEKFIGIRLENGSRANTIKNNVLKNNHYGMFFMRRSSENVIFNNSILHSGWNGIELAWYSNNNIFEANNIINSGAYGIEIPIYSPSYGNIIFHNNFLNNSLNNPFGKHASDFFNNSWYFNGEGNFWDDYDFMHDNDKDGIGDLWYYINEERKISDDFPLMGEFCSYKFLNETISVISSSKIKFLNITLYNDTLICVNVCLFEERPNGFLRLNFPPKLLTSLSYLSSNGILSIKTWSSTNNNYIYIEYPSGDNLIRMCGMTEIPEFNSSTLFPVLFSILLITIVAYTLKLKIWSKSLSCCSSNVQFTELGEGSYGSSL
ncbi:MAG: NosD domain-containing protein [Candidatus Bathyarchaeota archaeon]|jgi:parallel beta-helix repeat protein|nr:NosD domain-containing protein [Candidatus Bathyarchaeota archaeon]